MNILSKKLSLVSIILGSLILIPSAWAVSYTVNSTNDAADGVCDSNHCSLREAIMAVNRDIMNGGNANCTGNDEIRFNIPVSEATNGAVQYYSIKPTTPLPAVRCKVNLDGYTQPGAVVGSPVIELSGEGLAVTYQQAADYPVSPPSANSSGMPSGLVLVGRDRSKDLTAPHESQDGVCETGNAAGCKLAKNPDGSTVRGLVINKFPRQGIYLFGVDEVAIIGNFVGVDVTGQLSGYANGRAEMKPRTIGGTITGADEILMEGSSNNYIGTTQADYNAETINGNNRNVVGSCGRACIVVVQLSENANNFSQCSSTPFPGGCDRQAVYNNSNVLVHEGITSDNNVIQGNYVGLNKEGTSSIGGFCANGQTPTSDPSTCAPSNAIYSLRGQGFYSGTPDFTFDLVQSKIRAEHAPNEDNLVGGAKPGMGNVIASSRTTGGLIHLEGGPKTKIMGNIVGLNKNEEIANIPQTVGHSMVLLSGVWGNMIENNVLANAVNNTGIAFLSLRLLPGPYENVIKNNYIGTNRSGDVIAGGTAGITLIGDTKSNSFENNLINNNSFAGVLMRPQIQPPANQCFLPACQFVLPVTNTIFYPEGNTLTMNSIFSNNGLGIDLNATHVAIFPSTVAMSDGPTPNDALDADNGPNHLQNYPVLTSAVKKNPSQVVISGTLDSEPSKQYRIEFFANKVADPSGYGEGEKYIGSVNVTTDTNGHAAFTTPNLASSASRDVITATATDVATGDTSEFSAAITKQ